MAPRRALNRASVLARLALAAVLVPAVALADDVVTLDLVGWVEPKCEISRFGNGGNRLEFTVSGSGSIPFEIDCNVPMQIKLSSEHGALVNTRYLQLAGNGDRWSARWPYRATVSIDEIGFRESAASGDLLGGVVWSTGREVPFQTEADLTVELEDSATPLVAGSYEDVIRITVSPDPSAGGV